MEANLEASYDTDLPSAPAQPRPRHSPAPSPQKPRTPLRLLLACPLALAATADVRSEDAPAPAPSTSRLAPTPPPPPRTRRATTCHRPPLLLVTCSLALQFAAAATGARSEAAPPPITLGSQPAQPSHAAPPDAQFSVTAPIPPGRRSTPRGNKPARPQYLDTNRRPGAAAACSHPTAKQGPLLYLQSNWQPGPAAACLQSVRSASPNLRFSTGARVPTTTATNVSWIPTKENSHPQRDCDAKGDRCS